MKKIFNNTLILIMSTTTLVYLINNINIKAYFRILPCITIFPILLIPKILNKLNFKLTEIEETLYYIILYIYCSFFRSHCKLLCKNMFF